MQCTVIVRPESATRFVTCPVGLPQLESSAPTAAEALRGFPLRDFDSRTDLAYRMSYRRRKIV